MAKQVAPEHVVGRDRLIAQMWKTLEAESVVFTAERRIGKTTVMKKMEAEPPEGVIVLYSDLSKVGSPVRFVEAVLTDLKKHLSKRARLGQWFGKLTDSIGGTEIGGVIKIPEQSRTHWQSMLEKVISDACQNQEDSRLVFLWDEVPYMLQKINKTKRDANSSDRSALAILDSLRALRNENPKLRMLFTGSAGLHHVLTELRDEQFASQPTNDMAKREIGPLAEEHAKELAGKLLDQEGLQCDLRESVIQQLITHADRVPFYIQRVVSRLALHEQAITPEGVGNEVLACLSHPEDPWEMRHFRDRLRIYFPGAVQDTGGAAVQRAAIAKQLLSNLAVADAPQSIDDCHRELKATLPIEDRDLVIGLLDSLAQDHYLKRDLNGRYTFRFPLVRKWWVIAEGLEQ